MPPCINYYVRENTILKELVSMILLLDILSAIIAIVTGYIGYTIFK